jgi:hypothetical protein
MTEAWEPDEGWQLQSANRGGITFGVYVFNGNVDRALETFTEAAKPAIELARLSVQAIRIKLMPY